MARGVAQSTLRQLSLKSSPSCQVRATSFSTARTGVSVGGNHLWPKVSTVYFLLISFWANRRWPNACAVDPSGKDAPGARDHRVALQQLPSNCDLWASECVTHRHARLFAWFPPWMFLRTNRKARRPDPLFGDPGKA